MKKSSSKNTERKAQREAKAVQQHKTALRLSALAEREANSLVIGIDLGDRSSSYCVRLRGDRRMVMEGVVATSAPAMLELFEGLRRQLIVFETGTHSRWVAQLLELMGQEVIVANARKLKLISENNQKSDRVDARLLSELGCTNVAWLHGVWVRSEAWHRDLLVVRARQALVEVRTGLINQIRGTAKSYGSRLQKCSAEKFADVAEEAPDALQPAIGGVLATLRAIDEQIGEYDRQIEAMCAEKYPQTRWLRQVKGVGPVTALTYVLTIEDVHRFERSRDVGAYLGLVPKRRQSGAQDPQLGISKTGDEMLRKLLVNCAHYIIGPKGPDSDLRRWGLELVEASARAGKKKGARKRAATAVARKLAVLLHRLWVGEAEYQALRQSAEPAA
jgi:transposase